MLLKKLLLLYETMRHDMARRIGLKPVPNDTQLAEFLNQAISENEKLLNETLDELKETITDTINKNEPEVFAYGKMCNYLASLSPVERIALSAAALWRLYGQGNAKIYSITEQKDGIT